MKINWILLIIVALALVTTTAFIRWIHKSEPVTKYEYEFSERGYFLPLLSPTGYSSITPYQKIHLSEGQEHALNNGETIEITANNQHTMVRASKYATNLLEHVNIDAEIKEIIKFIRAAGYDVKIGKAVDRSKTIMLGYYGFGQTWGQRIEFHRKYATEGISIPCNYTNKEAYDLLKQWKRRIKEIQKYDKKMECNEELVELIEQ